MHLLVVLIHFARIIHRAEFRTTHGAESCFFIVIVGQSFIVHGARRFGIKRQRELLFPVERVAGVAKGIITILSTGTMTGDVGSVRGNLVGDDAVLHVFLVR